MKKRSPYVFISPHPEGHPEWYAPSPVDLAMQFKGGLGYYLHDAPWRPNGGYGYGTNEYHVDPDGIPRQGSHGCVNLPLWSAKRLYSWIRLGDAVRVVGR
jgi:lipoprotein-anchoring transpeptidase ErfK/SrfK